MAHPPTRPSLLPARLETLHVLEDIGRFGSTTHDQLVSLNTRQAPSEIATVDAIRMQAKTAGLAGQGLVKSELIRVTRKALRCPARASPKSSRCGRFRFRLANAAVPAAPDRGFGAIWGTRGCQ